ncbi:MAG: hypothetical protein J0I43_14810 [Microbacterium sp.]|uniref:hypothetical protein n=1 Tax=Microbacterium sp. TaxID=51671 RepID=UPI001AC883B1|nr:hypothetical protein [Microbacterium sp.]MBN9178619.1 hypothetical protein [Microbacterium sp.]
MTDAEVRTPVRSWLGGGALLAAAAVLPLVFGAGVGVGLIPRTLGQMLVLAAMVVFAFGLRGTGSLVARRPVGMIALLVLGLVPLVFTLATPSSVSEDEVWLLQILGYSELVVSVGAALVAAIEIARARVVPDPWRWAPTVALAVIVFVQAAAQVIGVAVGSERLLDLVPALSAAGFATAVLVPLALGVIAMMLGARGRQGIPAASPQVYPPA